MKINEIFYSIQGEGKNTGIPMVFVRLTGCNLSCEFCDTTYAFEDGEEMSTDEIIGAIEKYNPTWVCITGGEPFLQDLSDLTRELSKKGVKIHVETNGTIFQSIRCDWLVVSPKAEMTPDDLLLIRADEIKLVIDTKESLKRTGEFEEWGSCHYLQPESNKQELINICVDFIKNNPKWRLSTQIHKLVGIK